MTTTLQPTRRAEFWAGARATIPMMVGAMPFAIIFGALAVSSGLSSVQTVGMSVFIFAGSAQLIAVKLFAAGASVPVIILTTAVVNLRHVLYGATIGPHLRRLPQRWLILLGFLMTDEAFVTTIQHYEQTDETPNKHWYFLGSGLSLFTVWNFFTIVGIVAGQQIPDPSRWGLDFALDATFIAMLIPMIRNRPILVATLVAGATALLAHSLPNQLGLIVAALLGIVAGMAAQILFGEPEPLSPKELEIWQ